MVFLTAVRGFYYYKKNIRIQLKRIAHMRRKIPTITLQSRCAKKMERLLVIFQPKSLDQPNIYLIGCKRSFWVLPFVFPASLLNDIENGEVYDVFDSCTWFSLLQIGNIRIQLKRIAHMRRKIPMITSQSRRAKKMERLLVIFQSKSLDQPNIYLTGCKHSFWVLTFVFPVSLLNDIENGEVYSVFDSCTWFSLLQKIIRIHLKWIAHMRRKIPTITSQSRRAKKMERLLAIFQWKPLDKPNIYLTKEHESLPR